MAPLPGVNGIREFNHGWIAMRTAADPAGAWSPERKLSVGSIYDSGDDVIVGPPDVHLDQLHPDLGATLVISEPGLLATGTGLYATMLAADGTAANCRVILLRRPPGGGAWEYRGSFLVNRRDGPPLGCDGLSAPARYRHGAEYRLIATPQTADYYQGTLLFRVTDLQTATLERAGGVPRIVFSNFGSAGTPGWGSGL